MAKKVTLLDVLDVLFDSSYTRGYYGIRYRRDPLCNLLDYAMYSQDTRPPKTRRTDKVYMESHGQRMHFKLTMLLSIFFMYSNDGKLT